jgi:hypothetical protein
MNEPSSDVSPQSQANNEPSDSSKEEVAWDLGPDLKPPTIMQRVRSLINYAWRTHPLQIIIVLVAGPLIVAGILFWNELQLPSQTQNSPYLVDWLIRLQACLGIPTLIIAILVWYEGIRDDWENDLSKMISVFFFHGEDPLIICRYAWLAGPDELRVWGQQIGRQASDNENLDFSPNIIANKPCMVVEPSTGSICIHYAVCFKLTKLNKYLTKKRPLNLCRYQNLVSKTEDVQSIPIKTAKSLSSVSHWRSSKNLLITEI